MSNGANYIHYQLRTELENYIKSQYLSRSPILLEAVGNRLSTEIYQKPYIESSPAYVSVPDGIKLASIADWQRDFFVNLAQAGLGVYASPFQHQIDALSHYAAGEDLLVSTGTGSGKTECFMWPLLDKLVSEAHDHPDTWEKQGVRTIIMYPMNALVSDQVSRLRRLIGDTENKFVGIFREACEYNARRPKFGMYTGRTPYPGPEPIEREDKKLAKTLEKIAFPSKASERGYHEKLLAEGKVPAKSDFASFISKLKSGLHDPAPEDAELITRFEMQKVCPDILITNYSMLEYMLLRNREASIWQKTQDWLMANPNHKLLFVIDEAHMYRGASGGEVALLIRRMFHKLNIDRSKVQFILTTASMPKERSEDREKVMAFARSLTSSSPDTMFCYLVGKQEEAEGRAKYDIPFERFSACNAEQIEGEDSRLDALNKFWTGVPACSAPFCSLETAYEWMYGNLIFYRPFNKLMDDCRGKAVSLKELSSDIFPEENDDAALQGINILLAIAPLARNSKGTVLFPARMHMLFRGIKGIYACANPECPKSHHTNNLALGEVYLTDGHLTCPHCNSVVYELYNDRRCGALFYKGYILEDDIGNSDRSYLWRYPGQMIDRKMKEIHLFIPTSDDSIQKAKGDYPVKPCYLDVKSGFIDFRDDSKAGKPGIRKLYYCDYSVAGRPEIVTFRKCPHCTHGLSQLQLTSFSTRGNQSFFNLIRTQFLTQPAVAGKTNDPVRLPNEGRKVLLFSDSRQRAARLARDMSDASDNMAARQLFVLAINKMKENDECSMDDLYDYFCLETAQKHAQVFIDSDRDKFIEDCNTVSENFRLSERRRRKYKPELATQNAPDKYRQQLLRLFCGGYNTLYDAAICWIEPTDDVLWKSIDRLEERGLTVSEEDFRELFNAWMITECNDSAAFGHIIPDDLRLKVRANYRKYGLEKGWTFSTEIRKIMGWKKSSPEMGKWSDVLRKGFLDTTQSDNGRLYVDLSRIKPCFDPEHIWYRCEQCSEITPYALKGHCPSCGSKLIHVMDESEYHALAFWRKPVEDALEGKRIHVIDTEEHTAQLSHKDQRDNLWSKTEQYELRFQDLIQDNETPVDILSSTTTMEVGIDIGSLIAVGLRNIPPMRENYQQRAGRAGRRGASLSTIVTFCEDGPHDSLYFKDPAPMFRGDPRRPWIDVQSDKLLRRHINMIVLQTYIARIHSGLDEITAISFLDDYLTDFIQYLQTYNLEHTDVLLSKDSDLDINIFRNKLIVDLVSLREKRNAHPELYGPTDSNDPDSAKSFLDALYEEGIIPTYSFPKNVVSTFIQDYKGKIEYQVERGLDVAIGEYAPGRAIVVDKGTYQIGGLYYQRSEWKKGALSSPARSFIEDKNYLKDVVTCEACGWFGLATDEVASCPFCGNRSLSVGRQMLRPWGFAPRNGNKIDAPQLREEYTSVQPPLYSTLPEADEMEKLSDCKNIRMAARTNQRIIMLNTGKDDNGFMVCCDCGAAYPGDDAKGFKLIRRPYNVPFLRTPCSHQNWINVNLGFDFITDMLVLEFALNDDMIDTSRKDNPWLNRAAQSLAEALRLAASQELDIEFSELVTGYRLRNTEHGSCVDIYLYDSLSSGAGYAIAASAEIATLLKRARAILTKCDCEEACHKCLRHYRNQYVHGLLDRFSALELLNWGINGTVSADLSMDRQRELILPLKNILREAGCDIIATQSEIIAKSNAMVKHIVVYPAMRTEPRSIGTIYISDGFIKYAKPYAVQKILQGTNCRR